MKGREKGNRKFFSGLLFIALLLAPPLFVVFPVKASFVLTKSPTKQWGDWMGGLFAFASDNLRAMSLLDGCVHNFSTYNFDDNLTESDIIEKFETGIEHYESQGDECIKVRVSWDNGSSYCNPATVKYNPEFPEDEMIWMDGSAVTDWIPSKLSNDNLLVEIQYVESGGCFAPDTLVTLFNETKTTIQTLKESQELLAFAHAKQTVESWSEYRNHWLVNFTHLTFENNVSLTLYGEHKVVVTYPSLEWKYAKDLTPFDRVVCENYTLLNITSVEQTQLSDFYNIVVSKTMFWANGILVHNVIKEPWSAYVDWIPVRVTYSPKQPFIMWLGLFFFGGLVMVVVWVGLKKK